MDIIIPTDILQYILNPYLNYQEDCLKVEKVFATFKFSQKCHLQIKENLDRNKFKFTYTYRDGELIKSESWYPIGQKNAEENYKNGKLHGLKYFLFDGLNIKY